MCYATGLAPTFHFFNLLKTYVAREEIQEYQEQAALLISSSIAYQVRCLKAFSHVKLKCSYVNPCKEVALKLCPISESSGGLVTTQLLVPSQSSFRVATQEFAFLASSQLVQMLLQQGHTASHWNQGCLSARSPPLLKGWNLSQLESFKRNFSRTLPPSLCNSAGPSGVKIRVWASFSVKPR